MARGRSLAEFQNAFADEASCAAFLFKRRWPDGFVCPACGKRRANALKTRPRLFECLDCGRQTSVTAGTVMHRSRLPLVSGRAFDDDALQRHVGAATGGPTRRHLQDGLAADAKTAALNDRSEARPSRRRRRGRSDGDSVPGWRRVLRARQRGENSDCRSDRGHRARHQQAEAPAQGREVRRHALGTPAPGRDRR